MSLANFRKSITGLYYGWRMIGLVSALRVLGGGLHQYGFTVFFLVCHLGPRSAGLIDDRTHSYAIVFTAITVLLISTALTALLIKPWAKVRPTA